MKQEVASDQEAKRSNTKPSYSVMCQEEGLGSKWTNFIKFAVFLSHTVLYHNFLVLK